MQQVHMLDCTMTLMVFTINHKIQTRACGGGQISIGSTYYWGTLMGIHVNDGRYFGCYQPENNSATSIVSETYAASTSTVGWHVQYSEGSRGFYWYDSFCCL